MNKQVSLRTATKQDQPRIRRLVRRSRLNPTGINWQRFIVASEMGGEVIGCAQIKPHRDGTYELASLVVDPGFRGQGIARQMVEHLVTNHDGEIYLMCRSNLGEFYQRFGFESVNVSEMPEYFRRVSNFALDCQVFSQREYFTRDEDEEPGIQN